MQLPGYQLDELLHEGPRSRVWRGLDDRSGDPVVIRFPAADRAGPGEQARYQRAYELGQAADSEAVVRHLDLVRHRATLALVTEDFDGSSLERQLQSGAMALLPLLRLSRLLAGALARLHGCGLLHRDLRPGKILLADDQRAARFIELDSGVRLNREAERIHALDPLDGDLRYCAPEQIGRIDAPVDDRADLYSLGATLFHLATGGAPYEGEDRAELVHTLIAASVPTLRERRAEIPGQFARIVERLLSKNAGARYASAVGLARDLARCAEEFGREGRVSDFALGEHDVSPLFRLSDRLYGRQAQCAELEQALDRTQQEQRALVQVIGRSGVGKTRLVEELRPRTLDRGLRYCAGKFDQFHQDRPYLAFMQALRGLLRGLLGEPDEVLEQWREQLREALGQQAGLLTEDLPELKAILGAQAPVADAAGPYEAALRFQGLIRRFLRLFCGEGQGLVMFIDDLQWADPASINLLTALADAAGLQRLLIVLGYRSNELGLGHPAQAALKAWRTQVDEQVLRLGGLAAEDIRDLIADTLQVKPAEVGTLAGHVHSVAAGNVFFAREFLLALRKIDYFKFDQQAGRWTWDESALSEQPVPRELVGLLTARLDELPASALDLLDTASCVGSEFDLATLANVHQMGIVRVATELGPAVQRGLVVPLDASHRLYASLGAWRDVERGMSNAKDLPPGRYRFQHDAVRLSVHDHLGDAARCQRHYQIGRLLLDKLSDTERRERVVEVFEHLGYGLNQVPDPDQRRAYARLGLEAGRAALLGLAFEAAWRMLGDAAQLLGENKWTSDRELALAVHMALAECAMALERADDFEREIAMVTAHVETPWEKARAYALVIRVRTVQVRYSESLDVCVRVAKELGLRLPRQPNMAQVLREAVRTIRAQRGKSPMNFECAPDLGRTETAGVVHLLSHASTAAYFATPNFFPMSVAIGARLSLQEGMCPDSPYIVAAWGMVLCGALGQIERGYEFGRLAVGVGQRFGGASLAGSHFVVDSFIRHWKEPLRELSDDLYRDWDRLRREGDEERAVYCAGVTMFDGFLCGVDLEADRRCAPAMTYLAESNKPHIKHAFMAWVQLQVALREPQLPDDLAGEWFDTVVRYKEFVETNNSVQIGMSFVAAGIYDFLRGRHERAEQRFELVAQNESGIFSLPLVPALSFFRALNAYRLLAQGKGVRRTLRRHTRKGLKRLRRWAKPGPDNLAHRVSLLEAEEHLLRGRHDRALKSLHGAIERAAGSEARLYQALAEQRLGECLSDQGLTHQALAARERARGLLEDWGSPAMANALDDGPLGLLGPVESPALVATGGLEQLDLRTLLEGVRTISSEMDRETLILRLISSVMQSAGADRCLLILLDEERRAQVEAEARLGESSERPALPLAEYSKLARPAVDLALRTGETVLIGNIADSELLRGNAYGRESGVRSLLASCIQVNQRILGLIYLENHVAQDAFGPARVEIADALCAQAGIALENAQLYHNLREALSAQAELTDANKRFVPTEFLAGLGCGSIVEVDLNEAAEQEMAVVFCDLRGFTRISERIGPRRTIEMINCYLSYVQPAIAANQGFVGQYFGDGILALFPRGADDAASAAVGMCRGLEDYNRERGEFPELRFGIGIHSGSLILGTMGSTDHFQCGVVGDSVNLASRVEALTKFFGARVLLSGRSYERLPPERRADYRGLGRVQVPGRAEVIDVYESVSAYPADMREGLLAGIPEFERASAAYQSCRWEEAEAAMGACLASWPDDPVALALLERLRHRAAAANPWDGIERPGKNLSWQALIESARAG